MKRNSLLIPIAVALIAIAAIAIWFDTKNIVATVVTVGTAILGATAIWIQMAKNKEINTAGFILNLNEHFVATKSDSGLLEFFDKHFSEEDPPPIPEELKRGVKTYLRWIRDIVNLVNRKVVSLPAIDSPLGYKFFIIVNNPHVQEMEINKYSEYYYPFYECYKKWREYRIKNKEPIPNEKYELSKTDAYIAYFANK